MSALRRLTLRDWLILIAVVGLVCFLTAAFWEYTQDDVFITYTYSRNIAQGEGFVFNPGERVQGTTTPLYTLLMAGVYLITSDLLHAGNLLNGLFLLLTIVLAVDLLRRSLSFYGRAALALTLAVSPLIYVSFGMETLFYCALLLLAFWLWAHNKRLEAMLAAAALTWTRADGVVLAGTLGVIALWDSLRAGDGPLLRRLPWKLAGVYFAGIAPWFLFAWAYFGSPLPQTFSAKQELFEGTQFLQDGLSWWRAFYGNNPLALLIVPFALVGLWRAAIQPLLRPLALWPVLYLLGYTVLNVTAFWYYTPLLIVLAALVILGGEWAVSQVIQQGLDRRVAAGSAATVILAAALLAVVKAWDYHQPPPRVSTYILAGDWIAEHTDPTDTLLIKDLGIVGYHAHRYTLDSFGLIVPDMAFPHDTYAAAKYKNGWILTTQYWEMQRLAESDWFRYHYVPAVQFSTPGDSEFSPMTLFRRNLALQPPAQMIQGFDLPLTCTVHLADNAPLPNVTRARLVSAAGDVIVETSHPFLWNQYPAERTKIEETLIEQIALPLAVGPGHYRWELECDQTSRGEVEVLPIDQAPGYNMIASAEWGNFARLAGAAFPEELETWSGGSLLVTLHWEAAGPADQDYSVFLHMVDQAGRVVAQADGYPRNGERPATSWQAGETVIDQRRIMLPPDLPAGDYQFVLGWYNWQTNERLPLADSDQDAVTLPVTVINRWPGGSGRP